MLNQRSANERLYQFGASSFREGMRLLLQAYAEEQRFTSIYVPELAPLDGLDELIAQARQASEIYDRHVKAAEHAAVAEMRATGLEDIAAALETGEYSTLAF